MPTAPLPPDETARLEALRGYEILDSAPERLYDDLVAAVRSNLRVPLALLCFVDWDRQWFKAASGTEATETPRDVSICSWTILDAQPTVIENASEDPRFADNPLVIGEPNIRFYLGVPLVTPTGHSIGSLCAIDFEPRKPTAGEIESMQFMAKQVIQIMELQRSGRDMLAAYQRVTLLRANAHAGQPG